MKDNTQEIFKTIVTVNINSTLQKIVALLPAQEDKLATVIKI